MLHYPFILVDIFSQAIADFVLFTLYNREFLAFYGRLLIREEMGIRNYDRFCIIKACFPDCMECILWCFI